MKTPPYLQDTADKFALEALGFEYTETSGQFRFKNGDCEISVNYTQTYFSLTLTTRDAAQEFKTRKELVDRLVKYGSDLAVAQQRSEKIDKLLVNP